MLSVTVRGSGSEWVSSIATEVAAAPWESGGRRRQQPAAEEVMFWWAQGKQVGIAAESMVGC